MRIRGKVLAADNWFAANAFAISRIMEISFGFIWAVDASFKFQQSFISQFSSLISGAAQGQPPFLSGWFALWSNITAANPLFFAYLIIISESLLAVSLIFGIARKLGYGCGFIFSLLIWSVPEGFGGPYGPSSTDIGTGIIYAFVFIFLAIANSLYGPNKYTVDYLVEKRFPLWRSIAETKRN